MKNFTLMKLLLKIMWFWLKPIVLSTGDKLYKLIYIDFFFTKSVKQLQE